MYMLVYVDDILVAGTDKVTEEAARQMESVYKMTDFGRPKDFLGFEVEYTRASESESGQAWALLHQARHIQEMIERYGMPECRGTHSPWEEGINLSAADQAEAE